MEIQWRIWKKINQTQKQNIKTEKKNKVTMAIVWHLHSCTSLHIGVRWACLLFLSMCVFFMQLGIRHFSCLLPLRGSYYRNQPTNRLTLDINQPIISYYKSFNQPIILHFTVLWSSRATKKPACCSSSSARCGNVALHGIQLQKQWRILKAFFFFQKRDKWVGMHKMSVW